MQSSGCMTEGDSRLRDYKMVHFASGLLHHCISCSLTSTMATTAHTIYSRYNPKKREAVDAAEGDEEWASTAPKRHLGAAPTFVPASGSWRSSIASGSSGLTSEKEKVSDWYRSLTSSVLGPTPTSAVSDVFSHDVVQSPSSSAIGSSSLPVPSPSPARATTTTTIETSTSKSPLSSSSAPSPIVSRPAITEKATKNNWFIMNVIRSESTSSDTAPSSSAPPPPPSLADMIARDPPPQPSEAPFKPPVFLALGPANKGWAMLQQHGWREGEGLGLRASQKYAHISSSSSSLPTPGKSGKHNGNGQSVVKHEDVCVALNDEQDIYERRRVEVIDLTELSDEDDDVDGNGDETMDLTAVASSPSTSVIKRSPQFSSQEQSNLPLDKEIEEPDPYEPTALLTPIATVLKSDRLGIGLKAKTVGPYKTSQKRITHNDRALAAHIRTQEQLRKQEKTDGRGARGFARRHKREEESRRELIAYLNR